MHLLSPNQQCQSTEGKRLQLYVQQSMHMAGYALVGRKRKLLGSSPPLATQYLGDVYQQVTGKVCCP